MFPASAADRLSGEGAIIVFKEFSFNFLFRILAKCAVCALPCDPSVRKARALDFINYAQ